MKAKPFKISKHEVFESYQRVKAKRGSGGIDGISMADFDKDMKNRLYKIWNQMSSGSYMPPAVKLVEIPKANRGVRPLGIPTISDRIAQGVVKAQLEVVLEKIYHDDSYGFRHGKSAHDAIGSARTRCWKLDWVIDLDIKDFFDSIPHELLLKAVEKHCNDKWILLYINRWLTASLQKENGEIVERTKGVPQGSVIGPLLSNLYLHYTLDMWLVKYHPECTFERYADDAIVHCNSERSAIELLGKLRERMTACGLTLHPEKTKIVYCKDSNRRGIYPNVMFDFLGYTFMPRMAQNSIRKEWFTNFLPAVSRKSMNNMTAQLKRQGVFRASEITLNYLAEKINPILRGWINYYGRFYKTKLQNFMHVINVRIASWARRKYKHLRSSEMKAIKWLYGVTQAMPNLFAHWTLGAVPTLPNGNKFDNRSRMMGDHHVRFYQNLGLKLPGFTN